MGSPNTRSPTVWFAVDKECPRLQRRPWPRPSLRPRRWPRAQPRRPQRLPPKRRPPRAQPKRPQSLRPRPRPRRQPRAQPRRRQPKRLQRKARQRRPPAPRRPTRRRRSPLKKVAKGKVAKKASPAKKEKETKKKVKKAKDPNAPKRALSAFMYFAKEERPAVLKAHPDFKVPEIGKELGARWAKCGNKSKFEGLAAKDKARYDAEMKKFAAKNPKGPKRALSAFMFFAKEERAAVLKAHPDFKVPEIGKELGARWAKCKNKSKFEGLAAKDKARYEAEMKKVKK